jgi:hypothetical protein
MSYLYVAHQGSGQDGQLYFTFTRDGSTWEPDQQVPTFGMSDSPSALFFNDQLYCFYQGSGENGELDWLDLSAQVFVENFRRFARGEPLKNVVDKKAGY